MVRVAIIGGGLAGMGAALQLRARDCEVTIFEKSNRMGGKAGSALVNGVWEDHGFHVMPEWYVNFWKLVEDLGIRGNFVATDRYGHVVRGEYPSIRDHHSFMSLADVWKNITSGTMTIPNQILMLYSTLDLVSHDFGGTEAILGDTSVVGFLWSRFYRTEQIATLHHEHALQGWTVPGHYLSARSIQAIYGAWGMYPKPIASIARGNLQECLIEPIQKRLESMGTRIRLNTSLRRLRVQGDRVHSLSLEGPEGSFEEEFDHVIVAVPGERIHELVDDEVARAAPRLMDIRLLHFRPMIALHLHLKRKFPGLPKDTFNLVGSRLGITMVDISQIWEGIESTVLNVIAGNSALLVGLSDDEATRQIFEEMRTYLPGLEWSDVERAYYQSHVDEPLFCSEVGAYRSRPYASTQLSNLFLAGTYCRTGVSFDGGETMESALSSGYAAAEALRQRAGLGGKPVEFIELKRPSKRLAYAAKLALVPVAAAAKVAVSFSGT